MLYKADNIDGSFCFVDMKTWSAGSKCLVAEVVILLILLKVVNTALEVVTFCLSRRLSNVIMIHCIMAETHMGFWSGRFVVRAAHDMHFMFHAQTLKVKDPPNIIQNFENFQILISSDKEMILLIFDDITSHRETAICLVSSGDTHTQQHTEVVWGVMLK